MECLDGREEAVSFPGSVVEDARDFVTTLLGEVFHRRSLRQVLPNEAISVFVGASFPGVIWSGEVDRHSGALLEVLVAVELCSVVGGDGLE